MAGHADSSRLAGDPSKHQLLCQNIQLQHPACTAGAYPLHLAACSLKRMAYVMYAMTCASSQVSWDQQAVQQCNVFSCTADKVHSNTLLCPADGSQLVAGVGARVLIYDASDGELQHVLKGHKVRCCCTTAVKHSLNDCLQNDTSVTSIYDGPNQHHVTSGMLQYRLRCACGICSPISIHVCCRTLCMLSRMPSMESALHLVALTKQSSSGPARYGLAACS